MLGAAPTYPLAPSTKRRRLELGASGQSPGLRKDRTGGLPQSWCGLPRPSQSPDQLLIRQTRHSHRISTATSDRDWQRRYEPNAAVVRSKQCTNGTTDRDWLASMQLAMLTPAPSQHGGFATSYWLAHGQDNQLLHFRAHSTPLGDALIEVRRFHWVPPHLPVPEGRQVIPLTQALDRWSTLQQGGWQRVHGPVRQALSRCDCPDVCGEQR